MVHEESPIRQFHQRVSEAKDQCRVCGLVKGHCLCGLARSCRTSVRFVLLTHENEMTRTSNTGRLIEDIIEGTENFVWSRTHEPQKLVADLKDPANQVYLIFPGDRPEERERLKAYEATDKNIIFLIIDGTWKEVRKILRKSPYLQKLPILDLNPQSKTAYHLRRNKDDNHLCTAEVAIDLLKLVGDQDQASQLGHYYHTFLHLYEEGRR